MTETAPEQQDSTTPQKKPKKIFSILIWVLVSLGGLGLIAYGTHMVVMANVSFEAPMPVQEFSEQDPVTYDGDRDRVFTDDMFDDNIDWSALPDGEGGTAGVIIPALDVHSPMIQTGEENNQLVLPEAPVSTHYDASVPIGHDTGNAIVSSHVNGVVDEGQRAFEGSEFANLHRAESGMPVGIRDEDGEIHMYRITEMNVYYRDEVPADIFRTDGNHKLQLVTCSGETIQRGDDGFFEYNLIVTAEPID